MHTDKTSQVEYAVKAVENGGTAVGIRCKDGVVLAVEKIISSKLLKPGANKRIATVDRNIGVVGSLIERISWTMHARTMLTSRSAGFFWTCTRWSTLRITSTRRSIILAVDLQRSHPYRSTRQPAWGLRPGIHPLL